MSDRNTDPDDAGPAAGHGAPPRPLTITRDFSASRERVWRAWTRPDAIVRWYGPHFYPAAEVSADVRAGGTWRACLRSGNVDDVVLWQSGTYLVVTPPEHLEFTFAWETPGHEDGPGVQTHIIVRLEALPDGGTRMHFSQTGFLSTKSAISHHAGWSGTFERLEDFLFDRSVNQPAASPAPAETRSGSRSNGGPHGQCTR